MTSSIPAPSRDLPLTPSPSRSRWTSDTFVNGRDAEDALCAGRAEFLLPEAKELLPRVIWTQLINPDANAHIKGFRDLFIILDTDQTADDLRQLVVDHFNGVPSLRQHLREHAYSYRTIYMNHSPRILQNIQMPPHPLFPGCRDTNVSFTSASIASEAEYCM